MTWHAVSPLQVDLGESPLWHPDEQVLYWVDIHGRQIHRCNIFIGSIESWAMPSEPGSIAPARTSIDGKGANRGLVIALRDCIYRGRECGGPMRRL